MFNDAVKSSGEYITEEEKTTTTGSRLASFVADSTQKGIVSRAASATAGGGCTNWYVNPISGLNSSTWGGFILQYWWVTRWVQKDDFLMK